MNCDICNKPMTMDGELGVRVIFACACGQRWIVDSNSMSMTILSHLWPSGMTEDSPMYRQQYLPEWLASNQHQIGLRYEAGFIDPVTRDAELAKCQALYDDWFRLHPEPVQTERQRRLAESFARHSPAYRWSIKIASGLTIFAIGVGLSLLALYLYRYSPWVVVGLLIGILAVRAVRNR